MNKTKYIKIVIIIFIVVIVLKCIIGGIIQPKKIIKIKTEFDDKLNFVITDMSLFSSAGGWGRSTVEIKVAGKRHALWRNYFTCSIDTKKEDIGVELLLNTDQKRYYAITINGSTGFNGVEDEAKNKPRFIVIDAESKVWYCSSYTDAVDNFYEETYKGIKLANIFEPYARYYIAKGEVDWIVRYGERLYGRGYNEVDEIIEGIASRNIYIEGNICFKQYEVYNKCVELIKDTD